MTSNTKPQLNIQGREVVRSRKEGAGDTSPERKNVLEKEGAGDTSPERKNVLELISQKNKTQLNPPAEKLNPTAPLTCSRRKLSTYFL